MKKVGGSFRDPSGQVFEKDGRILRTINDCYSNHWNHAINSGLLLKAAKKNQVPAFAECPHPPGAWKCLEVEKIPFISYPYEWCFSQLKDSALLTLELLSDAIEKGMILKDASAYNIQFCGSNPVFIDLLSLEIWKQGAPWQAYRQFCMHFLAPLALSSYLGLWCNNISRLWIDGIPLPYACSLLPFHIRFRPGLVLHLFAHAHMEKRHADARISAAKAKKVRLSKKSLRNLAISLQNTIESVKLPKHRTQWSDYYKETNYSKEASTAKLAIVERISAEHKGLLAVDLGANTGLFSRILAPNFTQVLAVDIDPLAVERHYLSLKMNGPDNILPLVIDLSNPSPSLGWACEERDSFPQRCKADFVMALAIIHHLVITAGIPLQQIVDFFACLLSPNGYLLIEFVPKEDSQVQRLLATREDIFPGYNLDEFRKVFSSTFSEKSLFTLPDSSRTLICFKKR